MNVQEENKYERYALDPIWNLTPKGAKPTSCFILCDDAVKGIKILFGEKLDEENKDILILAHDWGKTNANMIPLWFQVQKLTAAHKVELCMTGPNIYDNDKKVDSSDSDDDDSLLDGPSK
jgi:hypothetical protein